VTVQLEVLVVPTWLRVQGLPVKAPLPLLVKLAVPPGADLVPESLSETSTVQVVLPLTATEAGEQPVTELVVDLR